MSVPSQVAFILDPKLPAVDAASAAFLSYQAKYFEDKVIELSKIRKVVATKFSISINQVLICGSAQFGYSFFKKKPFVEGKSDLDLAIVSAELFCLMYDAVLVASNGFVDFTPFDDAQSRDEFLYYVSKKGMIRPDLLPRCTEKQIWDLFFRQLSNSYKKSFKSISAAIYLSEKSFVYKQIPSILAARGEAI